MNQIIVVVVALMLLNVVIFFLVSRSYKVYFCTFCGSMIDKTAYDFYRDQLGFIHIKCKNLRSRLDAIARQCKEDNSFSNLTDPNLRARLLELPQGSYIVAFLRDRSGRHMTYWEVREVRANREGVYVRYYDVLKERGPEQLAFVALNADFGLYNFIASHQHLETKS